MLSLIGIVIIIIGFLKKYDTIAVVLTAGLVTGLVSGLNIVEILNTIGKAFIDTRYMSIFILTLPVIGILERYGLKEQSAKLIGKMRSATAGKVMSTYTAFRALVAAFGLRLGGHVQFVRPLINPMAYGATKGKWGHVNETSEELIKGYSAASENYGNFFAQNLFIASPGVLLIVGTLDELGIEVTPLSVSKSAIPVAVVALIFAIIQNYLVDKRVEKSMAGQYDKSKRGEK